MANTVLDFPFALFEKEADSRGYKATQYSKTGYFVKSSNGVRCEFQCTRSGINSVGYGSSAAIVAALKQSLVADQNGVVGSNVEGLKLEKVLTGSINFHYESIEKYFDMITAVEKIALPESKGKGGRPVGSTVRPAGSVSKVEKPKNDKATFKKVAKEAITSEAKAPAELDTEAKASLAHVKGPGLDLDAIKAANLERIKVAAQKMAEKQKATREADGKAIDDLAPGFDMPAFLMKDSLMDGKVDGAE